MKSQLDEGTIRHGHGEWHEVNAFLLLLLLLLLMSVHNEVVVDLCAWFISWTPRKVSIKLNIKDSDLDMNSICVRKYSYAPVGCMLTVETNTGCSEKSFPHSSPVPPEKFIKLYLSLTSLQFLHRGIQNPIQNPSIFYCHSFCQDLGPSYEIVNAFWATSSVSIAISKLGKYRRISAWSSFIVVSSMCSHTRFNAKWNIFDVCNSYNHVALRR